MGLSATQLAFRLAQLASAATPASDADDFQSQLDALSQRVTDLETTAADHEARITALEP